MNDARYWLVALLVVSLAACGGGSRGAGADDGALADTLAALIATAYDFEHPDVLARMGALYAESREVVSASGGELTVSTDSVRAGIARFWELAGRNMREAHWEWEEVHARRLGSDAAALTGRWTIPHIAPTGEAHVIAGAWTAIFERVGGEWKIVQEHLSAPLDAAVEDEPR